MSASNNESLLLLINENAMLHCIFVSTTLICFGRSRSHAIFERCEAHVARLSAADLQTFTQDIVEISFFVYFASEIETLLGFLC